MINQFSTFPPEILSPVPAQQFIDDFWEQKPLHISRPDYRHFAGLLSINELESALSSQQFTFPSVQLSRANQPVAVDDYTDSEQRIVLSRLAQHYQEGATVVFSSAHQSVTALSELTRRVQSALQLRSQANVYLSPPGRQGFNAHFDSHDVFVLQVSGSKTFRFYEGGVELPFSENSFSAENCEVGELTEEIQLNSGDTLYIPRGLIHDAVSDESQPSLHITLGVYALTMRSLLQEIVQLACEKDVRYRQSIDSSEWHQTNGSDQIVPKKAQQLINEAFTAENYAEALTRLRDDIALDTPQNCRGWLSADQSHLITQETVIRFSTHQILSMETVEGQLVLRVAGRVVHFDAAVMAGMECLVSLVQCKVSDISVLEPEQRLALVDRLYKEQLVTVINDY